MCNHLVVYQSIVKKDGYYKNGWFCKDCKKEFSPKEEK